MRLLALGLVPVVFVSACGGGHDTGTHRGFVEYQCQSEQERLEGAYIRPEFRPKYERLVEELCRDLRQSGSREEAVRIYREADTGSWYPIEEAPVDDAWSGQ